VKRSKYLILIAILGLAGLWCYTMPKIQYKSPDILEKLAIPTETQFWRSRDIAGELNLNDTRYNFVNRIFARQYASDLGESLVFLILDAGNFHHPQVCFGGAGYKVEPQDDIVIDTPTHPLKAKALYMEKDRHSVLIVYWITINKMNVDWNQQKVKEFFYSLFNKEKVGLMGRLEVPASRESLPQAVETAKSFLKDFGRKMPADDASYLFGERS